MYLQVDKSLSFLNSYVQQSLKKGAQPYIPEEQRSGVSSISHFRSQALHETSSHGLRFEAYELPKPIVQPNPTPVSHIPATELVPVPELSYSTEIQQTDAGSNEIRLRLDGVQKKWGKPSYSSSTPSTSNSSSQNNTVNGVSSKGDPRKEQVDPEKQKLAASLFGGVSKPEKRPSSSTHRPSKPATHVIENSQETKSVTEMASSPPPPPPDLLDLGESDIVNSSSSVIDPFKQLEGLIEPGQGTSSGTDSSSINSAKESDLMALYGDVPLRGQSNLIDPLTIDESKGPNLKEALQKDALVRQMGVTPTTQNPNLFKDLFG